MDTYYGQVKTPQDAIVLFEACRLGILPRVQRRLSERERTQITSGSVFVWDEREAGMRRWTDGKSWSASRVSGSFLTYREMEGRRGAGEKTCIHSSDPDGVEEGPDGFRYKPDGLTKQSFSITTSTGQHLHLISYFARSDPSAQTFKQPSLDPALANVRPTKGMYPESAMSDLQTAVGTIQGTAAAFAYSQSQHQPPLYGPPYSLNYVYENASNAYMTGASHSDYGSHDPRSHGGSYAVQPLSGPPPFHHAQVLQNGGQNVATQERDTKLNGHAPPPMVWYNNGYDISGPSTELKPSVITDFADSRCRYPSSSTAPSPGSDEKSQDVSPHTPSHPAAAVPGASVVDMDLVAVADSRQDDYALASPTANLSIEAIIHRDRGEAGPATASGTRYCKHVDRADSKSPSVPGRVPLSAQEIFKEKLGFAEDKRVLRQLDTNAFSVK